MDLDRDTNTSLVTSLVQEAVALKYKMTVQDRISSSLGIFRRIYIVRIAKKSEKSLLGLLDRHHNVKLSSDGFSLPVMPNQLSFAISVTNKHYQNLITILYYYNSKKKK